MKNKFLLFMTGVICLLMLVSCDADPDESQNLSGKYVDMTLVVPIHPTSLKYFDFCVKYDDNQGVERLDTIQGSYNGITVDDWNYVDIEITLAPARRVASKSTDCLVKTYSYDKMPVTCTAVVEMIPKKDVTTVKDFYFYIPKPYIIPSVHNSKEQLGLGEAMEHTMGVIDSIKIDSMSVSSFQSLYGTTFMSRCGVYEAGDGYEFYFN